MNGIYILPKATNAREWTGCVFVRKGIYQGGIFRFVMAVPPDWPTTTLLPKITFDAPLFQPSASEDHTTKKFMTPSLEMQFTMLAGIVRDFTRAKFACVLRCMNWARGKI